MRRFVGRALESGTWRSPLAGILETAWRAGVRVKRRLDVPDALGTIGVAGATLGGSGATPLVVGIAKALASRGQRVAVLGHGYRGRVRRSVRVGPEHRPDEVGDEAVWAARALSPHRIPVFVGSDRKAALAAVAETASWVVLDSVLQVEPRRLDLSVLVVDALAPWGAGHCPPRGDLRAPARRLLEASDVVCVVGGPGGRSALSPTAARPVVTARSTLCGLVAPDGSTRPLSDLEHVGFGLVTGVARSWRILEALTRRGLRPHAIVALEDHARASRFHRAGGAPYRSSVGLWVTTAKCSTKVGVRFRGAPVFVLDHRVDAPPALLERALARD